MRARSQRETRSQLQQVTNQLSQQVETRSLPLTRNLKQVEIKSLQVVETRSKLVGIKNQQEIKSLQEIRSQLRPNQQQIRRLKPTDRGCTKHRTSVFVAIVNISSITTSISYHVHCTCKQNLYLINRT